MNISVKRTSILNFPLEAGWFVHSSKRSDRHQTSLFVVHWIVQVHSVADKKSSCFFLSSILFGAFAKRFVTWNCRQQIRLDPPSPFEVVLLLRALQQQTRQFEFWPANRYLSSCIRTWTEFAEAFFTRRKTKVFLLTRLRMCLEKKRKRERAQFEGIIYIYICIWTH